MSLFCGSGGRRRSVIHLFSRDLAQGKVPAGHGLDRLSRTACDSSTLLRATSMQRCIGIDHFRRRWWPQARSTAKI